ncbi:hypothetical protein F5H01DRAFT_325347 [Linnemannia elongata]|nr:hypothetical protein F5H01DRAFT_325347 [Linnemannia elongata]
MFLTRQDRDEDPLTGCERARRTTVQEQRRWHKDRDLHDVTLKRSVDDSIRSSDYSEEIILARFARLASVLVELEDGRVVFNVCVSAGCRCAVPLPFGDSGMSTDENILVGVTGKDKELGDREDVFLADVSVMRENETQQGERKSQHVLSFPPPVNKTKTKPPESLHAGIADLPTGACALHGGYVLDCFNPPMACLFAFFCIVEGDSSWNAFPVSFTSNGYEVHYVGELKNLIKARLYNTFLRAGQT